MVYVNPPIVLNGCWHLLGASPADTSPDTLGKNAPYEPHDLVSGAWKLGNELTAELTAGRKGDVGCFFWWVFVQGFFLSSYSEDVTLLLVYFIFLE